MRGMPRNSRIRAEKSMHTYSRYSGLVRVMIGLTNDSVPPPGEIAARNWPYSGIISTVSGSSAYLRRIDHQEIFALGFAQVQERVVGVGLEIQRIFLD